MARGMIVAALGVALVVSGCGRLAGRDDGRVTFDGLRFSARVATAGEDGRDFAVTVADAGRNIAAAQEAGRYAAVKHCLYGFGASDIAWSAGPDVPASAVRLTDGALVLTGRCTAR